jgi:hypothetical protein
LRHLGLSRDTFTFSSRSNGGGIGGGADAAEDDVMIEHPLKIQQKN